MWTDATYVRMTLFVVCAYEIRDVMKCVCLSDHFIGLKLFFWRDKYCEKCLLVFVSWAGALWNNFSLFWLKSSGIKLSLSRKLNFQMKSWAFSFPPVFKIILSWSTTRIHWADHCGASHVHLMALIQIHLQGGLCFW